MDITSKLNKMSNKEKLRAMELIWDDLCRTSDFASPDWHKDILAKREKRIKEGKEDFLDWEESKRLLKENI